MWGLLAEHREMYHDNADSLYETVGRITDAAVSLLYTSFQYPLDSFPFAAERVFEMARNAAGAAKSL